LVSDSSSPEGPTVQQLNRATTGGDYFSPMLDVQPYESYCIRAKLKWVSGAAPFVGVEQYGNGVSHGVSWLIGTPYTDWRGSTRPISSTNAGWQEVGNTLQISYNTTRIRLVDELYQAGTKGGDPLAYFDGISVDNGSCTLPYIEDWESGTGGWKDLNGQAPALVTDASSPSGQAVQQVNRAMATAGGDYFSPRLEVVGGSSYCIRANLKWLSGAAPFVGIEQFANGNSQGINWLIGSKYTDAKGSTTVVSNTDTGWQTLETPLSLSENTTQVRLVDALFETGSKGGDPLADFDGISINTNYCWNNPPTVNMSTDKSNYLVGEPVVVNWSSRNPIGGQLQLSSGDSFSVAPALAGSHTFQNLPAGSYAMYFSYVASWYSTQIATTTFNIATGTTDKTEYLLGTPVVVNWGNLGASSGRVVIALVGSAPSSAGVASTNADLSTPGTYTFTDIPVGDYEVRFLDGSSNPIGTASTTISVYSKFAAAQPSLVPYDFIVATWRDVTPNAQDWVAIAPDSSSDATVTDWAYTGGVDGSHAFGPLAAGTYRARYFQSGTNTKLYESEAIQVKTLTPASFTYVDASDYHVCGVTPEHKVKCWGANWYGQLGNGTYLDSPSLVEVAGISTATAVGTGDYHTCAVTSDGKVHCWGANWYGQLGNGPSNDSTVPVEVAGISTATAVGTGDYHTCAMTSDGKVHCWGANWYGELGDGTATDSTMPVEVAGISNASAVRAGASHTCAVTSGGKVHCWGMNEDGQLGDGTSTDSTIPVEVVGISTATAVAAAAHHSCAVTIDGKVHCWGANGQGQLGNGTTVDSPTPVEVAGISTAVAVNLDDDHSCARLSDGTARCWGYNGYGQLGNGTRSYDPSSTAVEVVGVTNALGIYASGTRSCALLNTGVLQCWGDNSQGFLGDGTYGSTTEMGGVGNTNSISAGGNHVCASLIDGHVRCWGYNGNGQLGDGTTADRNTPVEVTLTAVADVNAGYYHTCTLGTDGRVHCWGTNGNGQLGDGTTTDSAIPVGVSGISAATAVGAGGSHTCALTSDGKVRCWGANWNGQLGDGTTNDSAIPVEVAGISTATAVSAGGMYTCALTSDGKVRCWGANGNGQLGDGTENDSAIAVEVAGISTATAVGGGNFHTCALTNNGKVMCWGYNGNGQLGNKTIPESFTPVEVVGITNAVSIDLGDSHSCARLNDGKVMCWGANWYGQLGDGTTTDRNIPIEMGGIDNAIAVSTGYYDTCVWHSNDKLRCWGDNSYGQFGDGKHPYALTPVTVMSLQ